MKAIEIQAPYKLSIGNRDLYTSIFLAGSIGVEKQAEQWQKKVINELSDKPYIFLNPRRDDWDSTWKQDINNQMFKEQVEWELLMLERADVIVMYFDPNTTSPISLLELGLHARSGKLLVVSPQGFWRKGNVDIVCERYNIEQIATLDELIKLLK